MKVQIFYHDVFTMMLGACIIITFNSYKMLHIFLVLMFNSEENDVKAVFHELHPEKEKDAANI